jgi:hypothetical protein
MIVIIVGGELGGLAGAIAAVPVTAVVRDVYIYLYQRLVLGASPQEAESHVPSRRDEIEAEKRRQAQRSLKKVPPAQTQPPPPAPVTQAVADAGSDPAEVFEESEASPALPASDQKSRD